MRFWCHMETDIVTPQQRLPQDRVLERPPFWRRHRLGLLSAAAVLIAAGLLIAGARQFIGAQFSVARSRLTIATVERGTFIRDLVAGGQIVAAGSPTLYAPGAGVITLKVHAGDVVSEGQILAIIDSPDLAARLRQEEATQQSLAIDSRRAQLDADAKLAELRESYQQAQVDQKTAQRELERSRKAYELGSYSELQALKAQDALEKAQFAFTKAKMNYLAQPAQNRFEIDSKKALLERQEILVADLRRQADGLTIRAPVAGQIGQVDVAERASIAKDAPLMTVVDLTALEVEIQVPESQARDLKPGMSAEIEGDGRRWQAGVSGVSPEVVAGQVAARLRFQGNTPAGLRQRQRLTVRILIDRRENVLTVDRGAFTEDDGGNFAYVVRDGVAERRPVRSGAESLQKVEILEGLAPGDQVITAGTEAFHRAERVIISH
jgi:HlyD family secretion protein